MTETATVSKKKTVAELQQEYHSMCLKAGHLQYQVYTYKKELEMTNEVLRDLNLEAAAAKVSEDAAAAKAAAEPKQASNNVVPLMAENNQSGAV